MISGIILVNGQPAPNQQIILLSADMDHFIAGSVTDANGEYKLELSDSQLATSLVLVSKVNAPVLALDYRIIEPGLIQRQDFTFDNSSDSFCILQGNIVADDDKLPSSLEIAITPVHLDKIPSRLESFFLRRSKTVVDASFYVERISGNHFKLRVQKGSYRISGSHITYKGPVSTLPIPNGFIVDQILADGERTPISGEQFGGFILHVKRDREITMHLKILS